MNNLAINSPTNAFGFDGDGPCTEPNAPIACGPTGYEGPNVSFSNISADTDSGVVDFAGGVPANGGTSCQRRLNFDPLVLSEC